MEQAYLKYSLSDLGWRSRFLPSAHLQPQLFYSTVPERVPLMFEEERLSEPPKPRTGLETGLRRSWDGGWGKAERRRGGSTSCSPAVPDFLAPLS